MTLPPSSPRTTKHSAQTPHRQTGIILSVLVIGMLGLAFASVPLYRLFCQRTGYGGTTQVATETTHTILERTVNVEFNTDVNSDLPWDFKALKRAVKVRVGESALTFFRVTNRTDQDMKGLAIYNVTPDKAGLYFNKVACFCFDEQIVKANQTIDMPVVFFIHPEFDQDPNLKDVRTITLSYTFFKFK